jgi:hypothetical protein
MLAKILGDDIERNGRGEPHIAAGPAADRLISLEDPEMHHGRKSAAHKFDGFKVATSIDQASELILDLTACAAHQGDGKTLLPSIARVEAHAGVTVASALGAGAYGSGENRAACAERPENPIDLLAPMRRPHDPEVDKAAFDLETQTATCPHGQTVRASRTSTDEEGRTTLAAAKGLDLLALLTCASQPSCPTPPGGARRPSIG